MPTASPILLSAFSSLLAITILVAVIAVARLGEVPLSRSVGFLAGWMLFTGFAAHSGILARWDLRPPPAMPLFVLGLLGTIYLTRRPWARRVAMNAPLSLLVGFHAFRLPLELSMHRAFDEGLMPVQMSFSGANFDILTGIAALLLGLAATRMSLPRPVVWAFAIGGFALLCTIVGIAVASMPTFAFFGDTQLNIWVTRVPFVWLPTIFVPFALFGQLLLFQRLRDGTVTPRA